MSGGAGRGSQHHRRTGSAGGADHPSGRSKAQASLPRCRILPQGKGEERRDEGTTRSLWITIPDMALGNLRTNTEFLRSTAATVRPWEMVEELVAAITPGVCCCSHSAVEPTSGSPFCARLRSGGPVGTAPLRSLHAEVPSAPPADIPVAGQGNESLLVAEEQTQQMGHLRLLELGSHCRNPCGAGECPACRQQSWFCERTRERLRPEDTPRPGARWRALAIRDLRALDASGRTR
jgi:hypothetical protein